MLGKLDAPALAPHAAALVAKLQDSNPSMRSAAVSTLGKLDKEVQTLMEMLTHADGRVRGWAVETLGKLDAPTVATHAAAIVSKLEHSDEDVRWRAVKLLGKLDKKVLMAL